ncbi:MAG: glycosyltransferase family A protein [Candidatus Thiodiazotropha sp. LLP2]
MTHLKPVMLNELIGFTNTDPEIDRLIKRLNNQVPQPDCRLSQDELVKLYDIVSANLDTRLSENDYPDSLLEQQQLLFHEMESQISQLATDDRHDFFIVIPIADRPQHLKNCLNSLLTLCDRFRYGSRTNNRYKKINVLVADDSQSEDNRETIRQIVNSYDHRGLSSNYFGPEEQQNQLAKLDDQQRLKIKRIIGDHPAHAFYHKGASITRNICYLKLSELINNNQKTLIWFVDSDQEFRVNYNSDSRSVYGLNYFHQIDRIFTKTKTQVVTGKVVGDPPVSPAVMGGNFLDDVAGFISKMESLDPDHACEFHQQKSPAVEDAAYHDMAELFGFKTKHNQYNYSCTLDGDHSNKECLTDFAAKLHAFFDGQHPTRQSYYIHSSLDSRITPARTVYTGNYIINATALCYFIPFATLRLRMAGPVLGRLLKSELDGAFVSTNLPLIHKRTLIETRESEFRPGVKRQCNKVNLSGEFERQFFGDVMLFTIQKLTELGFPKTVPDDKTIEKTISLVTDTIHEKYLAKQDQISNSIDALRSRINHSENLWQTQINCNQIRDNLNLFLNNMEDNFGKQSNSYQLINNNTHRQSRCNEIKHAIINYPSDQNSWVEILRREQ